MHDLVGTVIHGILEREQLQQSRSHHQTNMRPPLSQVLAHGELRAVGKQTASPVDNRDPELWRASKQFEAIFLQQMMSEMRSTVSKSDFIPHGYAEDVQASMMDAAMAQASINRASMGIANTVYRQLEAGNRAQAIPNPTDKLNMASDLTMTATMEANKDAH